MTEQRKKPGRVPTGRLAIHTRLDPENHRRLKAHCEATGDHMGVILDRAITIYFNNYVNNGDKSAAAVA